MLRRSGPARRRRARCSRTGPRRVLKPTCSKERHARLPIGRAWPWIMPDRRTSDASGSAKPDQPSASILLAVRALAGRGLAGGERIDRRGAALLKVLVGL